MICQGLRWENDFKDKSLIEKYNISFKVRFFLKNFHYKIELWGNFGVLDIPDVSVARHHPLVGGPQAHRGPLSIFALDFAIHNLVASHENIVFSEKSSGRPTCPYC